MNISDKLQQSVIHHWDLLCVIVAISGLGFWWGSDTFATEEDIQSQLAPLQVEIAGLKTLAQSNSAAIGTVGDAVMDIQVQIQLSSLEAQRREINRDIREIENAQRDGLATEREVNSLPDLYSDLQDIQDDIDRLSMT